MQEHIEVYQSNQGSYMEMLLVGSLILIVLNGGFTFFTFHLVKAGQNRSEIKKFAGHIFTYSKTRCC